MTRPPVKLSRPYGGVAPDVRQADRRQKLIDAAIRIYGRVGFRNASVKAVCVEAGLTERYFYQAFSNREHLLLVTYETVNSDLVKAILEARGAAQPDDQLEQMVRTYFTHLRDLPTVARLFLIEVRGVSPAVEAMLADLTARFATLLVEVTGAPADDVILHKGVVGGLHAIALAWVSNGYVEPLDEVVEAALTLCSALTFTLAERRRNSPIAPCCQ